MLSKEVNESFRKWMSSVARAAIHLCYSPGDMYFGPEGCKRLARECGYAIPDFTLDRKEQDHLISSTYSAICVIAYRLNPPMSSKEWINGMREGRDEVMEARMKDEVHQKANPG